MTIAKQQFTFRPNSVQVGLQPLVRSTDIMQRICNTHTENTRNITREGSKTTQSLTLNEKDFLIGGTVKRDLEDPCTKNKQNEKERKTLETSQNDGRKFHTILIFSLEARKIRIYTNGKIVVSLLFPITFALL